MVTSEVKQRKPRVKATEAVIVPDIVPVAPVAAPVPQQQQQVVPQHENISPETLAKMTPKQKSRAKLIDQVARLVDLNGSVGPILKDKALSAAHKEWIKEASKLIENVEKCAKRDLKPKNTEKRQNTSQSGILKKVTVAPEMCQFAGWPVDSLHSHVEISQELLRYIKEKNLQNADKRKEIIPDATLANLLKYNPEMDAPLDYNKVQRLISRLIL